MSDDGVVHLIDDDDAVRDSLAFMLSTAGLMVRRYASAAEFLGSLPKAAAGCVVTDIRMPGIDGLELQRRLKREAPAFPVIVMTGHGDVPLAVEAMKAGAVDFIEKPFADDVLLAAIQRASEARLAAAQRREEVLAIRTKLAKLTPRETEVLAGLVKGHPNKTIGYDLDISPRTVEVHRAMVMAKMGARSLPDLIRMTVIADEAGEG